MSGIFHILSARHCVLLKAGTKTITLILSAVLQLEQIWILRTETHAKPTVSRPEQNVGNIMLIDCGHAAGYVPDRNMLRHYGGVVPRYS